jgi:hypothetical protein
MLSCVGDHILQEFNTLFLTRFRTYKIDTPLQQKPRRGGDFRQRSTWGKVPLQVNIFTFGITFYQSNLSTYRHTETCGESIQSGYRWIA